MGITALIDYLFTCLPDSYFTSIFTTPSSCHNLTLPLTIDLCPLNPDLCDLAHLDVEAAQHLSNAEDVSEAVVYVAVQRCVGDGRS